MKTIKQLFAIALASLLVAVSQGATNQQVAVAENAAATTAAVRWPGGAGTVFAEATWAGATAKLQIQTPQGTWVDTGVSFTANGQANFSAAQANIRVSVSGGPPSALYVYAVQNDGVIPAGSTTITGGGTADSTAANQTTQIAAEQAIQTTIGATTDAAAGDSNATVNAHTRQVAKSSVNIESYTSRLLSSASPKAPGAALATTAIQIGCTYNSGGVTLTNTQEAGCQYDANGRMLFTDPVLIAKFVTGTPSATSSDSRIPTSPPDGFVVSTTTISGAAATATVTTPIASPGVVNWTTHGLATGTPITITGGTLPGELTTPASGATFYVINDIGANSFHVARTPDLATAGTAINFTGTSSGTQTGTQLLTQYTVKTAGYQSISHQTINAGTTNTTQFEVSDDAQTWNTVCGLISNGNPGTGCVTNAGSTVVGSWRFPTSAGLWFRSRLTTYTSGSYITAATLRSSPFQAAVVANSANATVTVAGPAAEGAGVSGNPLEVGYEGRTTEKTAVSDAQVTRPVATKTGKPVTMPYAIPDQQWFKTVSLTDTTSTALNAAAGSGVKNYITWCRYSTVSTTTAVSINILDGSTTIDSFDTPGASDANSMTYSTPIFTTANTAANVQLSGTPTGAVRVTCGGYKAP